MAFCYSNWNRLRQLYSLGLCYPMQVLNIHGCPVLSYWKTRRQEFPAPRRVDVLCYHIGKQGGRSSLLHGECAGRRRPGQTHHCRSDSSEDGAGGDESDDRTASYWARSACGALYLDYLMPASLTLLPNPDAFTLMFHALSLGP